MPNNTLARVIVSLDICSMLLSRKYDDVDRYSRRLIKERYSYIENLSYEEVVSLIDRVTGGLGYKSNEPLDIVQMNYAGSYIAWPEKVTDNSRILEVGTGLGRTAYVIHYVVKPRIYITMDISGEILYLALYRNPIRVYQDVLWLPDVKIVFGDAVKIINCLNDEFDHIIHDGGPNPRKNKRLYSKYFLDKLVRLLKSGGSLSIFIGSERKMQERIYSLLVELGLRIVETVPLPFSRARVIHACKL